MKGNVFNIQRYAVHDGAGIRTVVFLKGCPLKCPWCCNPESQSMKVEKWKDGKETVGKMMSVGEVVETVLKDEIFFRTSGGGVTLSGGEILAQGPFAIALLKAFKSKGIHTAIETTGHGAPVIVDEMSRYVDQVLFDLKIMNQEKAREVYGANLDVVKHNFATFQNQSGMLIPRIPLIPGYTMDDNNINSIICYLKKELRNKEVHLLPFHQFGSKKYEYLNREYTMEDVKPSKDDVIYEIQKKFEQAGFDIVIEGLS